LKREIGKLRRRRRVRSLSLPKEGEIESAEAREIVEACLQKSFGFNLAHGLILRVLGVIVEEA
jgi:hypothetical protein